MPNRYDYELELLKNRQQSDMVLDELDLSEPDVLPQEENATDQHPGVFKSLYDRTGVSAAKPIPTKVDQFPEVNFEESPIQKSASGKTMSQSELSLPPIPNFEVPEFSYPEYQPLEQNNGDSKTKRLLAYLNMAGNDFIRGATGFKPDDGVASGMLEQANQIDKNKTNEKQRLDQYLKNKYDAYNNYNKLKMQADSLRNNALYRRSLRI
ncbi:hypothetical protein EBZ39_08390 [bacterium]|nr:hypothetical protein [bacterium]